VDNGFEMKKRQSPGQKFRGAGKIVHPATLPRYDPYTLTGNL
jgi:hypothetical protein